MLACRQLRQWLDAGYKAVPISVNISRRNIVGGNNFLAYALDVLAEYQIPINLIQLEILETDASVDSKLLIRFLQIFKSSGFSLAMDDFGSGYSSIMSRCKITSLPFNHILNKLAHSNFKWLNLNPLN